MPKKFGFLVLMCFLLLACSPSSKSVGTLQGQVSIGPLMPAIQEGMEEPTPAPEVFAAREIVVFKPDGQTEVTRLHLDDRGQFGTELPVGTYVVDINHVGIDTAEGYPKEIEILAGQITWLEVDIDTGIR